MVIQKLTSGSIQWGAETLAAFQNVLVDEHQNQVRVRTASGDFQRALTLAQITSIQGVVPASVAQAVSLLAQVFQQAPATVPVYRASSFIEVSTAAVGANFTAFPSTPCQVLQVENNTGADIEVKKGSSTAYIRVPSGAGGRYFSGISNANELSIRRVDVSNTQVNIKAEAILV